ncbi:quinolinate synthase NadA [Allorhodopirellula heiligendammensis]|uniref:Quinolinate synthase n=1 Tax=Allorhodopirellula heiligendammensis TaxID=2714739 RepID=A0A5C6BFY6_9BACT|nr:quinolinate synthase NadA [Allorhodopirellula heiligendammensis]TWU10189.1 Quinolinate synthase A [Allorhodopirellula heiligendammensis]
MAESPLSASTRQSLPTTTANPVSGSAGSGVSNADSMLPLAPYKTVGEPELRERIESVREEFGKRLLILGHHYQQDDVIAHTDLRGDSYQLSEMAASSGECRTIVFCGVHFMAETADILANTPDRLASRRGERVNVLLPDMAAGCSMADMAGIRQVEAAWADMGEVIDTEQVIPVTYINSAASLKAFCGRHGGIVCTSSNAQAVLKWAFERGQRVLFFPDQHLGRNTALTMDIGEEQMPVWDPYALELGGNSEAQIENSRVILWKGHCSVHQMFRPEHVAKFREDHPGIKILVHPECPRDVNDIADISGSTGKIINTVKAAAPGTKWAIGTELHLVNRLKAEHPEQEIHFLSPVVCMCATMYRIDLPHLCWTLENLREGNLVNQIRVDDETMKWSLIALERMLAVK